MGEKERKINMNANNSKVVATVGLLSVVITQIFLTALGVNNVSIGIYVTLILAGGIVFTFAIMRSKNEKLGKNNRIMSSALMLTMCTSNAVSMLMFNCYPEFVDQHKIIAISIVFLAFLTFFILPIFFGVLYLRLKNNKKC